MLRTRLAAMGATNTKNADGSSRDMDTAASVLSKRNRTVVGAMDTGADPDGNIEKHPKG